MSTSLFYGKRRLCSTDPADFINIQGIGSDPLFQRYDSVLSVIKHVVEPQYQGFLAQPEFREGVIYWWVPESKERPRQLSRLTGADRARYDAVKNTTLRHYREAASRLPGPEMALMCSVLIHGSDDFFFCYDNKVVLVAWGMEPDPAKHKGDGAWIKEIDDHQTVKITFDSGEHGMLELPALRVLEREKDTVLSRKDVPAVKAKDGYAFRGWTPEPVGCKVEHEMRFTAVYDTVAPTPPPMPPVPPVPPLPPVIPEIPAQVTCRFHADRFGNLQGNDTVVKLRGESLNPYEIPVVKPVKGYRFTGWSTDPLQAVLDSDCDFTAMYEKKKPWWKGWGWLKKSGWLWWLLSGLLLLLLLFFLLSRCGGSVASILPAGCHDGCACARDGAVEQLPVGEDGRVDNGHVEEITGPDGSLPDHGVVAPVTGEDGQEVPIIDNEGTPDVVANRLNIFFENTNADLNGWAKDFKAAYPGEEYKVIGYDPNVRMIQIQMPENQRDRLRTELPAKLSRHKFFVVDESIMESMDRPKPAEGMREFSAGNGSDATKGWHLKATGTPSAWSVTKGSPQVVVAVVDDGIETSHPMFGGRFYKGYNVFTQTNRLSLGQGHGTHVAGLAAGYADKVSGGIAGVAPAVKIMPVQIFDNNRCTLSAMTSGIMYAIHNGADVVNISVGPSFPGLNQLPVEQQKQIAREYFKNEEAVFRHIIRTANEKNVILVFAAGNDAILTEVCPELRDGKNSINVAAVGEDICHAEFTNYYAGANISAPGVGIWSAFPKGSYKSLDGTSMAAPMVAGAVALMRSVKKDLTVGQALGVLQSTGVATDGNNAYVPPMIHVERALQAVRSGKIPSGPVFQFPGNAAPPASDGGYVSAPGSGTGDPGYVAGPVDGGGGGYVPGPGGGGVSPAPGGGDDYSDLERQLAELRRERDELNKRIGEIENQLGRRK